MPKNLCSLALNNQIGKIPAEIAKRIIAKKADKNSLYINMSAVYINSGSPVNNHNLNEEIKKLNVKLAIAASYYKPACDLYYKKIPLTLSEKSEVCERIRVFAKDCKANITADFNEIFDSQYNPNMDEKVLRKALHAIIDLSENNRIGLLSKLELEKLLSLDLNKPETWSFLKTEGYFFPSLQNILMNKGEQTAGEYLNSLERLASSIAKINLGFISHPGQANIAEVDVLNEKQELLRNKC